MNLPLSPMSEKEIQGMSVDRESGFGTLRSEKGPFPLQEMRVLARIDGLSSEVEVCQSYVNHLAEAIETTYIFPLPDRAAVTSFEMEVAGRRIAGVLKERGQARKEYDQAIQAGHRAAISEEERPNVFTLRVGNILPGECAHIRFRMVMPLLYGDGEATFRFPLVVAPRYIPGAPLPGDCVGLGTSSDTDAVPDASRITPPVLLPGFPNPVKLDLSARINPGAVPVSDLKSSLHGICLRKEETGVIHVDIQPGERLNRDFIIRFKLGDGAVRNALFLRPDSPGANQGVFSLMLVPPVQSTQRQKPRDLVFLLDRSGSMSGWKMVAARRALARMIDTLTDSDRFTVMAFDDGVELPPGFPQQGLQAATASQRFHCVEWLHGIQDRGGTELYKPLDAAVSLLAASSPERDRSLVLLTDGQVGNEDQILHMLGQRLAGLRIFTLGIDQAVNEGFLKRLAMLGGGATEIVESEQRLDEVMDKIHRRLGTPVLTGLRIAGEGLKLDMDSVSPHRLPDLFVGTPLVVAGRYEGNPRGSITVHAQDVAGRPWHAVSKGESAEGEAIAKLWARNRLRDMEDLYATRPAHFRRLEEEIIELSLKHGVLCRFTAYLAVDHSEAANPDGTPRQIIQPVDAPAGWGMFEDNSPTMLCCVSAPIMKRMSARFSMPEEGADFAMLSQADDLDLSQSAQPPRARKYAMPPAAPSPGAPVAKVSSPDLSAYRLRVGHLLEMLLEDKEQSQQDRVIVLGMLLQKLQELLEDLHSISAQSKDVAPLEALVQSLQAVVRNPNVQEQEVSECWRLAEKVLGEYSGDPAAPAKKRSSFWKLFGM